jgi:hypothetical protein
MIEGSHRKGWSVIGGESSGDQKGSPPRSQIDEFSSPLAVRQLYSPPGLIRLYPVYSMHPFRGDVWGSFKPLVGAPRSWAAVCDDLGFILTATPPQMGSWSLRRWGRYIIIICIMIPSPSFGLLREVVWVFDVERWKRLISVQGEAWFGVGGGPIASPPGEGETESVNS